MSSNRTNSKSAGSCLQKPSTASGTLAVKSGCGCVGSFILKENVELRAQLELLTSKYGKLEENHEKLSSSNEDLLASHARLKLAHEAITTKVISSEPHVDYGTNSNKIDRKSVV